MKFIAGWLLGALVASSLFVGLVFKQTWAVIPALMGLALIALLTAAECQKIGWD